MWPLGISDYEDDEDETNDTVLENYIDELPLNNLEEPTLTSWTRPGAEAYVGQDHDPTWMPDMRVGILATSNRTSRHREADHGLSGDAECDGKHGRQEDHA